MKKYFLFLMIIPLLFLSCSDGDSHQNFLERYDKSVWEISLGDVTIYEKFHNNKSNPIEEWHKNSNLNCLYYFSFPKIGVELIEVSNNQLMTRVSNPEDSDDYRLVTFTENGNTINLKVEIFENGISNNMENYILNRSSFKPENVQICSNN